MVTFILPGYSKHNKEWADECSRVIDIGQEIRPVYWGHWDDPEMKWDPKEKVRLIVDVSHESQLNVIAKSIGTYVASMVLEQVPSRIQKVIFCGIPLNDETLMTEEVKEVYRKVLSDFPADKIIVFQNDQDPHASYDEVKDFLAKINNKIKVISKPRNDHEYPYFAEFEEFLKS